MPMLRELWIIFVWMGNFTGAVAQLPPEILVDRYLLQADQQSVKKDHGGALESLQKILALQKEHELTLPKEFQFRYAQVAFSAGLIRTALAAVNQYLAAVGRDGKFYREALKLSIKVEQAQALMDKYPDRVEQRMAEEDYDAALDLMDQIQALQKEHGLALPEGFRAKYSQARIAQLRPEMVVIPAGRFRMGCVSGRNCYWNEFPVHEVQIKAFELSKYEVTFEEYDRFTDATGRRPANDEGWGRGRRPVINVSWGDAVAYTQWLLAQTGERYRLPSEAEWEYAERAGTETEYSWGNEIGRNRANCEGCGSRWDGEQTAPVGSFRPNAWGLHDMSGNVWEWVQDCWNDKYRGAPTDGSAWQSGDCSERVSRGGVWNDGPWHMRAARRGWGLTGDRSGVKGFRVARTIIP